MSLYQRLVSRVQAPFQRRAEEQRTAKTASELWAEIASRVVTIDDLKVFINVVGGRHTVTEGLSTLESAKQVIDTRIPQYDIDQIVALYEKGPWNEYGTRKGHWGWRHTPEVMDNLMRLNEWTNTVGYLRHRLIEQLGQRGEEGIAALRELHQKREGFKNEGYNPNGGRSGSFLYLKPIADAILQQPTSTTSRVTH